MWTSAGKAHLPLKNSMYIYLNAGMEEYIQDVPMI